MQSTIANRDSEILWLKQQLAEKDRQIEHLLSKPRTVTHHHTHDNRRYLRVENNINCFGDETVEHITHEEYQELLRDPEYAVSQMVRLRHQSRAENNNIRCPNKRESKYLVVQQDEDGCKVWRYTDKMAILEKLWQTNGDLLENEADEDTHDGARFIKHQERVKASMDGDGRLYREQLSRIHETFIEN